MMKSVGKMNYSVVTLEEAKSIEKKFANSCFAFKKDGEVYNEYKEILIGKVKNN